MQLVYSELRLISKFHLYLFHQLLANAVLHGVLPVVYEYEGTTLNGLLEYLTAVLQGRKARFELSISLTR